MKTPTHTTISPERALELLPLLKACKDDAKRRLLRTVIREGRTLHEFIEGFVPPYNVTDLIMVDVAKTMRRQH